jgi:hypothetical protein
MDYQRGCDGKRRNKTCFCLSRSSTHASFFPQETSKFRIHPYERIPNAETHKFVSHKDSDHEEIVGEERSTFRKQFGETGGCFMNKVQIAYVLSTSNRHIIRMFKVFALVQNAKKILSLSLSSETLAKKLLQGGPIFERNLDVDGLPNLDSLPLSLLALL